MALLDVTDVLYDPDFTSIYDLYRDATTVVDGLTVSGKVPTLGLTGVVQPAGARSLDVLPEGERRTQSIDIWTTTRLSSGSQSTDADEVVWQGSRWRVMNVLDWSNHGAGFVKATCQLMQVNPS